MSDAPLAVLLHDVHYEYPNGTSAGSARQVLAGVDLSVAAGERVAILGPNGAGKTTLALHLNGILRPTAGRIEVGGQPVNKSTLADVRRRVGLVFQDPDDQLFMTTVGEDVAFGPRNLGIPDVEERVVAALGAVGLADVAPRPPQDLSFGQRRRAAIATVLAMQPDLLVLDEPTANLDPAARRELTEVLLDLPVTLLLITHDLPYALQLCSRSVVLADGRIAADGPTATLLADAELMQRHRLELPYAFDLHQLVPPALVDPEPPATIR